MAALGFGALALILVISAPPSAAAAAKKVKTSAGDLFVDADSVNGAISSKRVDCERGRKVKLRVASDGDKVIGTAKTDKQGRWLITIRLGVGTVLRRGGEGEQEQQAGQGDLPGGQVEVRGPLRAGAERARARARARRRT